MIKHEAILQEKRYVFLKRSRESNIGDMSGLKYLSYEQRLQRLGVYSQEVF